MVRKTRPAHNNIVKISAMRGSTLPVLLECWNDKGKKVAVRMGADAALHIANILTQTAESVSRDLPLPAGVERVKKND